MSGYPDMRSQEIIDIITTIILYFQECETNRTLPTLLLMLPYDISASIHRMEIFLKHIQALTDHPMAVLIPDIKATNALLHELLPMLPFEPSLSNRLQNIPMEELLKSL